MNTEASHTYRSRYIEALGIAESIVMAIKGRAATGRESWGNVGDMAHLCEQLRELEDRLYQKGEYAPENAAR
jgi:hypothetical protein